MKRSCNVMKDFGMFPAIVLTFGLLTACEKAENVSERSGANRSEDSASESSEDEVFQLDLHRARVSMAVNNAKGESSSPSRRGAPCPKPELPTVKPDAQGDLPKQMSVRTTERFVVYACSKTPDQLKALWAFGQSLSAQQLANLATFDEGISREVMRFQALAKIVGVDQLIALQALFCERSATGVEKNEPSVESEGKVQTSDKEDAPIPAIAPGKSP